MTNYGYKYKVSLKQTYLFNVDIYFNLIIDRLNREIFKYYLNSIKISIAPSHLLNIYI
jgi:hypothetical protein